MIVFFLHQLVEEQKMYRIVAFTETQPVEWVSEDSDGKIVCWWPPYRRLGFLKKSLQSRETPELAMWMTSAARVLGTAGQYYCLNIHKSLMMDYKIHDNEYCLVINFFRIFVDYLSTTLCTISYCLHNILPDKLPHN